jgi:hypothetical protein
MSCFHLSLCSCLRFPSFLHFLLCWGSGTILGQHTVGLGIFWVCEKGHVMHLVLHTLPVGNVFNIWACFFCGFSGWPRRCVRCGGRNRSRLKQSLSFFSCPFLFCFLLFVFACEQVVLLFTCTTTTAVG